MKKLQYSKKKLLDRRNLAVQCRQFRENLRSRRGPKIRMTDKEVLIKLPKSLRITKDEDHIATHNFLMRVERTLERGRAIKFSLCELEFLWPCATLIFLARLEIWMSKYPSKVRAIDYPKDEVAEELLQHVGVLEKLGLSSRRVIQSDRVRFWHYHSGKSTDPSAYQDLTETIVNNIDHEEKILFADCLNEAVNNCVSHAYRIPAKHNPPASLQNWWILSQLKENQVFVAIYDSGITIPVSLRKKYELADLFNMKQWKDSKLLEMAASTTKTRTKLPERGKGLPEMLEFSKKLSKGGLSILSGTAYFNYNAGEQKQKRISLDCPILGTLVLWSIPFQDGERIND